MVIIMDMDTGKHEYEFGDFRDEVLNAQWLPNQYQPLPLPECQLGLQEVVQTRAPATVDAEAFLRNVYLSQE